jgi:hypothetical protein
MLRPAYLISKRPQKASHRKQRGLSGPRGGGGRRNYLLCAVAPVSDVASPSAGVAEAEPYIVGTTISELYWGELVVLRMVAPDQTWRRYEPTRYSRPQQKDESPGGG